MATTAGHTSPGPRSRQSLMTLRVYTTTRDGIVVQERAQIHVVAGDRFDLYGLSQAWPPCRCPRHRRC
ncbi:MULTISPECIES: hypothetical protein [Streptomyces]|uniref:Uncharacterized protein n=1 Tax=Streptomyces yunnanensis TaxID=156453 RepID=A0ABY8A6Q2_9ACTN|nr:MULTISPECIES: hypothetical protein [Streptomyces]AJC56217.1 hypothetical protein GZL_03631 [Streptomyces sp. 769]WEB40643.1 hypothetical protein MOV08_16040 [Streptomyces yunnanensis]